MSDQRFPSDFVWGAATASYQVEGAYNEDGRGPSIWDTFSRTPGKTYKGQTGDIACDHYHRYPEDVKLMKELGLDSYRFSIAWPRIFPEGRGEINQRGVDFYSALTDELLNAGIKPAITLYHWDLPQALEDRGGWRERDTSKWFSDFADTMFRALDDKPVMWITLNEPLCSAYLGHLSGVHAPGMKNKQAAYSVLHHLLLGHGYAVENYRESYNKNKIGIALNIGTPRAADQSDENLNAADLYLDPNARMFLDPLFDRGYPQRHIDHLKNEGIVLPVENGDLGKIAQPMDFLGLNYYFEFEVSADKTSTDGFQVLQTNLPKTDMGWDIAPEGLLRQLKWVSREYNNPPVYITENGAAFPDLPSENGSKYKDTERIAYLEKHLNYVEQAVQEGINIKGYFLWSFIDNFEWAYGYSKRFGIVYCDYETLERIPKESFYYYREYIRKSRKE